MKIGILKPSVTISPTGGVRIQALMWRESLIKLGHKVDLINMWQENDWKSYDILLIIDFGGMFRVLAQSLKKHNDNIVIAPIIDPNCSKIVYKFLVKYWGSQKFLGLTSRFHDLYIGCKYGKLFLTRSNQETAYLSYCCDIPMSRIVQLPLSLRFTPLSEMPPKEDFCFHASRLVSKNKNVTCLIEAAKKYKFNLVLAGYLHGESEQKWLHDQIDDFENIKYVGKISDNQLMDYYKRAKVFALPSLVEGVGMVALEAAGYGCEIVLTNIGAPKDYFAGRAELVNPRSVDEIGKAVIKCMQAGKSQPELLQYIKDNYTMEICSRKLEKVLLSITNK